MSAKPTPVCPPLPIKYFFDTQMMQTKMYCPLEKPVNGAIYSTSVFIKVFTNENVMARWLPTMVIPKGYKLEVVAK